MTVAAPEADMAWVPGATFRMGSDAHYPEEAPAHRSPWAASGPTAWQ
jgi:formylglycine-generating enzyme required for sulfatase activity